MRNKLYLIVEGIGEETAAPVLIRRILYEKLQRFEFPIARPLVAKGKGSLTSRAGLEYYLERARAVADCAAVLVLVDAEKEDVDCPPRLAKDFAERSQKLNLPFPVAIVVAVCEYESWFLANLETIAPKYFINGEPRNYPDQAEAECSAKGWLERQMPKDRKYKETLDQEKMSHLIELDKTYDACRSFKRLVDALGELLKAIETNTNSVSPAP